MATTLAMLESKATTAEKLILMLRQQIGEARAAQVVLSAVLTKLAPHELSHITGRAPKGCLSEGGREAEGRQSCS